MAERVIRIRAGSVEAVAELNDTDTADAVWQALPISGVGQRWGEEVYFSIPLRLAVEAGTEVVVERCNGGRHTTTR